MSTVTKMNISEYLSKDILEEDFIKVFSSFNIVERILGSSRVDARDCFVSPPTFIQKLYTVITWSFFSFLSCVFIYLYVERYNATPYVGNILQIATAFYILETLCNMIHVRFLNNEANIEFYIKIQETDRAMGIGVHKVINSFLRFVSNTAILSMGAVICMLVVSFLNLGWLLFGYMGMMYTYGIVLVESVHCISLSEYFVYRLRFINSILVNYMEPVEFVGKITRMNVRKTWLIRQLAAQTHDFRTWDVDIHLKALFECYEQFQYLYRFQVLLSLTNYIVIVPITVEYIIKGLQNGVMNMQECVVALNFLVLSTFQVAFLCFRLQLFSREAMETKRLCIRIMAICFNGPIRYKAKKTLKIIEENPPSFKLYNVLEINAEMVVTILSFVSFLVVTLLQFAFL